MGFLMMFVTAIGGFIGAVALGLLKDEATAWLPSLNKIIIAAAVNRVPAEQRERYKEEWAAHVAEYPGKLSQLVQSIRCFSAGCDMEVLTHAHVNRMITLTSTLGGLSTMTGILVDKYQNLNFFFHHLLGFSNFATSIGFAFTAGWMIWRRPQVTRVLRSKE